MLIKAIRYFDHPCAVGCDARCDKAWGIHARPRIEYDQENDYAFLADGELGIAPVDPGTYEGRDAKPTHPHDRLNRWCVRECERSSIADLGELVEVRDFSVRQYNQPERHT